MFSYSTGYYVLPPDDQYLKFKNRCSLIHSLFCIIGVYTYKKTLYFIKENIMQINSVSVRLAIQVYSTYFPLEKKAARGISIKRMILTHPVTFLTFFHRARICKTLRSPESYRPARLHRLANRFLGIDSGTPKSLPYSVSGQCALYYP